MEKKFDWKMYIQNYEDLQKANIDTPEKAFSHWKSYGKKENRTYEDLSKIMVVNENINYDMFDWNEYMLQNPGIFFSSKKAAWKHWLAYDNRYKKAFSKIKVPDNYVNKTKELFLPDIRSAKIGIIYVYYEIKNKQKNQTNLSFFLKYGLAENKWLKMNITTLVIINGYDCEVMIPTKNNIKVLRQKNKSDWEGWLDGINFFENEYGAKIYEIFDYICLINASSIGPIYENNINQHWLIPFYEKMKKNNAVICCPCANMLSAEDAGGPGIRVGPIFSLIKISPDIIKILTNDLICNVNAGSINKNFIIKQGTVLGPKDTKIDAALIGEYGLSRILLNNNYNLSWIYDEQLIENVRIDFSNNNNHSLLNTIFIKNNWRWDDNYSSLPVLYKECIEFVNNKLNITDIFNIQDITYNYELLNVNEKGINYNFNNCGWNNKKEYFEIYGFSEENVLFPYKTNKINNSCVVYAHYDSENIIKDYVLKSLKVLYYLGYDILFYTASEKILNVDLKILPFDITFFKNENVGTDWKILLHALKKIHNNSCYEWIFFINDSLLFPINGITNFLNTINNMRQKSDFWGHWDSYEIRWHNIGAPIEFKSKMTQDIINFLDDNIPKCRVNFDYIDIIETKFSLFLVNKGYKNNVVISDASLNKPKLINIVCPSHNPLLLNQWINNKTAFAIKWKYTISYLNDTTVSRDLNFLTKNLYYGQYGLISKAEKEGSFVSSKYFEENYIQRFNYNCCP